MTEPDRAGDELTRAVLEHLRRHGDGELREIASEVLGGSLSLSEAGRSEVYSEALGASAGRYADWQREVGADHVNKLAQETTERLAELDTKRED